MLAARVKLCPLCVSDLTALVNPAIHVAIEDSDRATRGPQMRHHIELSVNFNTGSHRGVGTMEASRGYAFLWSLGNSVTK